MAAVGLKLGLAGAARTYGGAAAGGRLTHQVRPHAGQAGQEVLVLRKLNLELAFACARPLGEDVEDEAAAVQHTHAQLFAQHTHLAGRELVVEYGQVALRVGYQLLELGDLSAADKAARVGRGALLEQGADNFAARRLDQGGELLHALFGGALA